jgi:prolyl oligopeptidase
MTSLTRAPAAALLTFTLASAAGAARAQSGSTPCPTPSRRHVAHADDYHGTEVRDPYRWLEDTESDSTRAWIEAQNCRTFAWLGEVPERAHLRDRLTRLWNYERYSVPVRRGGRYFWTRNDGLQNQAVLYWQPALAAEPRVLLDPNPWREDGTMALAGWSPSPDGRLLAYAVADGGSDWREVRVRDVDGGADRPDLLRWVKFSGMSWTRDNAGFFYSRYPEPPGDALRAANRFHRLYYHRVGTPQSEDILVYERLDRPDWGAGGQVSEDGRSLIIVPWLGTDSRNRLYYVDLGDPMRPNVRGEVVRLVDTLEASYRFVGSVGPVLYLLTTLDAPRGRVIAVDPRAPDRAAWREIIPQGEATINTAQMIGGRFVISYLEDAHARLSVFATDGRPLGDIALPTLGTVGGVSGRPDETELFYAFTSYLHPTTIYRHDLASGTGTVLRAPRVDFDASRYETRQVFYRSRDGTRVPMFLTHRRGLTRDGRNPTYLTGYGGFNVSQVPAFSVSHLAWLELGGVLAVPNLRGGGEYGEDWHRAGMLERKQTVFDDFIAAAEWLIGERYTSPERLAIAGGSNGGLLVGAVLNQRPDLFGAAIPAVGVMDMLRFHRFTIGWAWVTEYGSADSTHQFPFLFRYSPLHNIRPGTRYPAVMVTTADRDDRVVPGHSFKYAATLQEAQAGPAPILIRVETRAGHGADRPTQMVIAEQADRWAFVMRALGMSRPGT